MAGEKRVISIIGENNEAENGILLGTAEVEKFEGDFSYWAMEGGGSIKWEFDLAAGGVYGMNVWSNLREQGMRGQHFKINGKAVRCVIGWGELEFRSSTNSADWMPNRGVGINQPDTLWNWYFYPPDSIHADTRDDFVFVEGTNTIEITPSWGYQDFAGIDLIAEGVTPPLGETVTGSDLVIALRAPDAKTSVVTPVGEGAPWIASGFQSVALGSDGGVILALDVPTDGEYRIQIYYQNYSGLQTGEIQIGGGPEATTVLSVDFASDEDSLELGVLSDLFAATAGARTLILSGDSINVDYVQLIEDRLFSTRRERDVLPTGYALAQNYPNPFNPVTTISFTIPRHEMVKLVVYNILGQHVTTLVNERTGPGTHSVIWNGTDMAGRMVGSGIYFYRIKAGDFNKVRKFTFLK
ncbi:hypothetical protein ES703_102657 [subsurface metagenome]